MLDKIHQAKLQNAVLFFLDKRVKYPTITKLLKLLWFSDCYHVMRAGFPIFRFRYKAFPYGPVPGELIDTWRATGKWQAPKGAHFVISNQTDDPDAQTGNVFRALKKPDMGLFSPFEIKILEEVAFTFSEISPSKISDLTHIKNAPWTKTLREKGERAEIDLTLAIEESGPVSREEALELMQEMDENYRAFSST